MEASEFIKIDVTTSYVHEQSDPGVVVMCFLIL